MPRLKPPPNQNLDDEVEDPNKPVTIEVDLSDEAPQEWQPGAVKEAVKPTIGRAEEPEQDEGLGQQLEAQKRAEEYQRQLVESQRQAAEWQRQLAESRRERDQERGDREEAQYNSMLTAIAAEQTAMDKAESDYASAAANGDWAAAARAQRIIGVSGSRLDRLEEGKRAFESRRDERPAPSAPAPAERPSLDDMIRGLPAQAQAWLRVHPEFMTDAGRNAKIQSAHSYITNNRGIPAWTPAYFDALDEEFGFKKNEPSASGTESSQSTSRRSMPVTAPVSRDVPSASGTRQRTPMHLNEEEREVARNSMSWLPPAQAEYEYAKNKAKLQRMRANGTYRRTTEEQG